MSGLFGPLFQGDTIHDRHRLTGGVTSGFDYMRIVLAIMVVVQHSFVVTDQPLAEWIWGNWPRGIFGLILPAFFVLSGFLVAGSLERQPTIAAFVAMRVIRLLPALAVEVLLSAILIGAFFTELPLAVYFQAGEFWRYFLNIIGFVQFSLPGVFTHAPFPAVVNQSLWTIPYELDCYIWLVGLYLFGFVRDRRWLLWMIAALAALGTVWLTVRFKQEWAINPMGGRSLVVAFLAGVAIKLYGDVIRLNGWVALICLVSGMLLLLDARLSFLAVLPLAYATVYLGMFNPKRVPIVFSGDYSYGLYLFAFPIQQMYVILFPHQLWWGYNSAFTLVIGFAYAALSWWCIEAPILRRKREVSVLADRLSAWVGAKAARLRVRWRKAA